MLSHGMNSDRVDLEKCTQASYESMLRGLNEKTKVVPMIPTYLRGDKELPENRYAVVVDAGGTNYRTALVSFADGKVNIEGISRRLMPGAGEPAEWSEFIKCTADGIEPFLDKTDEIGVCFSYPAEVTPDKDSRVMSLTKQVKLSGSEGRLIGEDLNAELTRRGYGKKKIVVLNDTPATLLGGIALRPKSEYDGIIGMVAGTGVNTCCMLPESKITKLGSDREQKMLINLETGSSDCFPRGDFDLEMDENLPDKGCYTCEKMCSGAYFGELCRYTLRGAAREKLFSDAACEYLIKLDRLKSQQADAWALGNTPDCFTAEDTEKTVYIIHELFDRSVKCMSCTLTAIMLLTDAGKTNKVCISSDGSLFKKSSLYRPLLEKYLLGLAGEKFGRSFEFVTGDEMTIIGTAAAVLIN